MLQKLCSAINEGEPKSKVKYILMNTVFEIEIVIYLKKFHLVKKCIIWLLRLLVPLNNEEAADYLRTKIGQNDNTIKWVVVH